MPLEFGVEVDFDVELFIFFGDNDTVDQHSKVGVADSSVFNNLFYNIDALFHFSLAFFDGRIVVSNGINFVLKPNNIVLANFQHFGVDVSVRLIPDTLQQNFLLVGFPLL